MEHSDLVQDMTLLEKLSAQERLKQAKRRRQQQITNWLQREETSTDDQTASNVAISHETKRRETANPVMLSSKAHVRFPANIVLLEATTRQDFDEVRCLLQSGKYHPNTANEDGLTPIHQCSIDNSEQLLRLMIEFGGDVNAKDRDLWTPLHAAATCGHMPVCKILVDHGADLLALNADGNMAYDICDDEIALDYIETEMDRVGITQEMIDQTRSHTEHQMLADLQRLVTKNSVLSSSTTIDDILSYKNDDGATPLHIACANGYQTVVDYLLQQRVSIHLRDADGWKPIHAAAFWCQQPILAQLIQAGADIHEKVSNGRSALDLCEDPDLRRQLIDVREQYIRDREKAAIVVSVPVKTETSHLTNTQLHLDPSSIPNATPPRPTALYESRSSVSSPYGSGSSLNRTSSIRRASMRDRERVKKLNENFLDVLQAKDRSHDDLDESINKQGVESSKIPEKTDLSSNGALSNTDRNEPVKDATPGENTVGIKTPSIELPPLKAPPPLPPIASQATADTLSDVKRRREERRRGVGGPFVTMSPPITPQPVPTAELTDTKQANGIPRLTTNDLSGKISSQKSLELNGHVPEHDREKRICCTIL